ncbi:MAG: TetR/AcrR family transcriptional regulator [Solirubrobacterales bacterium]
MDAAATLFERHGYHGTSMQDIAEAVEITKSALYHYVRSKEQLVFEIHDAFVSTMIEDSKAYMASHPDPEDQLEFIVTNIFAATADYRPYVRAFFQDVHNLEGEEWYGKIVEKRDEYEGLVVDCLTRGAADGIFELEVTPILASRFLFGACNWSYQWLDPAGPVKSEEMAKAWYRMLLKAFTSSDAGPPGAS